MEMDKTWNGGSIDLYALYGVHVCVWLNVEILSLNIRQNADIINLRRIFRRYMLVIIYLTNFFCRHDAFIFLGNFATVILGLLLYICANERVMFSVCVCVCMCV